MIRDRVFSKPVRPKTFKSGAMIMLFKSSTVRQACAILLLSVVALSSRVLADPMKSDQKFSALKVEERRKMAQAFANNAQASVSAQEVATFAQLLLSDTDREVRQLGTLAILSVAIKDPIRLAAEQKRRPRLDFEGFPELKNKLITLLRDEDEKIRTNAYTSLAYGFDSDDRVCKILMEDFGREKDRKVKTVMLGAILECRFDSEAIRSLVVQAIDEHPSVAIFAIKAIGRLDIIAGKARLIDRFPTGNFSIDTAILNCLRNAPADLAGKLAELREREKMVDSKYSAGEDRDDINRELKKTIAAIASRASTQP